MFPFMAGIFISLCLQSPHRWKFSKRGGRRFTSGGTSRVYSYPAFQVSLTGAHHPGCSKDSLGIILARSGCCACPVAGAQMSLLLSIFSLPRAQIHCEVETHSHLTCLSLLAARCRAWSCQGHQRRGGHVNRPRGDPRGCAHPLPRVVALECSLLACRKRGSGYRDTACGIQVSSMCYRCAGLRCTVLQQAYGKKHSWLMKSFRADKAESWWAGKRDVPAASLLPWLEL